MNSITLERSGDLFLANTGDWMAEMIRGGEVYDQVVISIAKEYIRPGTTVLDVGACYGQMAFKFSSMTGLDGRVYAFECNPLLCTCIGMSVQYSGVPNINVICAAVWDVSGELPVFPFNSKGVVLGAKSFADVGVGWKIPTITLDQMGIEDEVSFLKVDAQGADLKVLRGAVQLIQKNRMPIIYEVERKLSVSLGDTLEEYRCFVDKIGYVMQRKFHPVKSGDNYLILPKEMVDG